MKFPPALVAASHGTSHPGGQRAVATLVRVVTARFGDLLVREAFVDVQQPDVPKTVSALEPGRDVVVVPLLLSAGYHVHVDLTRAADDATDRHVRVAAALGPDARLAGVLCRRLEEAGLAPDDVVVLAAAGSSDRRAVEDCRVAAAQLAEVLRRPVTVGFISAATPRLSDAVTAARIPGRRTVIASYLLAPGYFAELAQGAGADLVAAPLLIADGATPPELVEIVCDRYLAVCNADVSASFHKAAGAVTTW